MLTLINSLLDLPRLERGRMPLQRVPVAAIEPYVQTEPEQAAHGSGLGLAFSRSAVRAHGGEIWMESASGEGATVTFTLPRAPGGGS